MITQEYLHERYHYDQHTGEFIHKKSFGKVKTGQVAGTMNKGYIRIKINGKSHFAHRLAFVYMENRHPVDQVDHIDRNTLNNAWKNLREVSQSQNMRNRSIRKDNRTGYRGVSYIKKTNKFRARIRNEFGKQITIGLYKTAEEASKAYEDALRMHGGM